MMNLGLISLIVGLIIIFIIIIGLVVLVVWAARRTSSPGGAARPQTARDVLELRYARGEITREQYQQMKEDLNA